MKDRIKQLIKVINSGRLEISVCGYQFELYWPHITFTVAKNRMVIGMWAKTLIVARADNNWVYKWAAAVAVLGFGVGLSKKSEKV